MHLKIFDIEFVFDDYFNIFERNIKIHEFYHIVYIQLKNNWWDINCCSGGLF